MDSNIRSFLNKYRVEFIITALIFILAMQAWYNEKMLVVFDSINFSALMIILSSAVFFIARISYPKIYKFKILLSGYALIAFVINFLIITSKMPVPLHIMGLKVDFFSKSIYLRNNFAFKFLLTVLNLNLLAVMLVNAFINYNTGKTIAWATFAINVIFYLTVLSVLPDDRPSRFVSDFNKMELWINLIVTGLIVIFSFFNIEEEHNYGSIIVAVALIVIYCIVRINYIGMVKILMPVMMIIIIWGMFAHWVNCLHHRAHYDPLLKIYNRQYMDNIIHGIADMKFGRNISVMMCDIDHFKKVNDTYGHAAGDAVLFHIAQIIRETSLPEGVVCRYGGEEIIVFLRDKIGEDAVAKAEKIRKAVKAASTKFKSKNIKVTLSLGVASTKEGIGDVLKMIKKADDCVYKAKKSGRDKVVAD